MSVDKKAYWNAYYHKNKERLLARQKERNMLKKVQVIAAEDLPMNGNGVQIKKTSVIWKQRIILEPTYKQYKNFCRGKQMYVMLNNQQYQINVPTLNPVKWGKKSIKLPSASIKEIEKIIKRDQIK